MATVSRRPLGSSGIEVSPLSLGSWMTFEHLPAETGAAVLSAARDCGINFLDDARYDDHTGTAPLRTGYSEVVFGELFRAVGWRREEAIVANKLWWEFWPQQSAAEELDASLGRMGFDYVDLIYACPPPEDLRLPEILASVGDLISSGRARSWGITNWPASLVAEALRVAGDTGVPAPCAAQLPYSLVQRSWVEGDDMLSALRGSGVSVVASATLAGGALTGKYAAAGASGRLANRLDDPRVRRAVAAGEQLAALAARFETTPSALAIAFALANPDVASVLFGATSPAQVADNVSALDLLSSWDDSLREELDRIGR